jgi:hypothetical protein
MNDVGRKPGDGAAVAATQRRHRGRRAVLAVAAAAATALTLLAAAPGGASAATGPATTGVPWHTLTLLNHWHSEQKFLNTGDPAWAVRDGVVYLRGVMAQSPASGTASGTFAVLPKAARPARKLYLSVDADGVYGDLIIFPGGVMNVSSPAPLEAKSFTSLDGISFPLAPTTGHALTMLNGWKAGNHFGTGVPSFWKENGVVHLLGSLVHPTSSGFSSDVFAVLPAGARPARVVYIDTYGHGGGIGAIQIATNGAMRVLITQGENFTSLAAISFPAAPTTGHKLTLINGWVSSQSQYGTGDPAYWVSNGIVHLLGSLKQPSGTNGQFAVLPPAARPTHFLYIPIYTNNATFGWVGISSAGQISVANFNGNTPSQLFTSLATISYPVNS